MKSRTTLLLFALAASLMLSAQNNRNYRLPDEGNTTAHHDYSTFDRGFWIAPEFTGGIYCDFGMDKMPVPLELDVTGGYRFNEYLKVGIGFGARYYINNDYVRARSIEWSFPVYANVRGNFISSEYRQVVPYYCVDLGGAIRDGFMWRPTVGLRIGENRSAFLVGLSYMGQCLKRYDKKSKDGINDSKYASFLMLRLGYEF